MNNRKSKVWSITAGIIFSIVVAATIGLIVMVEQLDMLPLKFLAAAGLALVFVWMVIFFCLFMLPFSSKKKAAAEKKTGKTKYVFRTIGMLLAATLIAVDVVGMSFVYKLQSTISNMVEQEKEEVAVKGSELNLDFTIELEQPFIITRDPFIVYISGNDTKSSMEKVRSDVNILGVVNPTTKQVLLINTPRDYYVEISESDSGERDKLTHCGIYGMDCSIETLNNLYDIEIDYYAQVSFRGFERLIDAIGGISVYSEKSFVSTSKHVYFEKGTNYVNGEEALEFVRERHAFGDGDAARGRHQMAVIQGVINKMSSGTLLTKYGDILDSIGKYFRCDLSETEIAALVKMQLSDMAEWQVQTFAVTGEGKSSYTYSLPNLKTYVMIPDEGSVEYAHNLIDKVFAGETITEEDLVYVPGKEDTTEEFEIEHMLLEENVEDTEMPEVTIEDRD